MPTWERARGDCLFLGGSFNPPHIGHFRLALEAQEALHNIPVAFLPCASPVHKASESLLPFALRAQMLERVLAAFPAMFCDTREGQRPGPSYTWETLRQYRADFPDARLFFLVGSPDFAAFPSWHRGTELPNLANILVVPRDGETEATFREVTTRLWPEATAADAPSFAGEQYRICGEQDCQKFGSVYFLQIPWLAISASAIRKRWLSGLSTDFLIPEPVALLLEQHAGLVRHHWQNMEK